MRINNLKWLLLPVCLTIFSCADESPEIVPPPVIADPVFYKGADLSFSPQVNDAGIVFHDSLQSGSALSLLKAHGVNLIRLRLWHDPADGHSSLDETLAFAKEIQSEGLAFLLDIHYSDTWADPSHQVTPAAWTGLNLLQLEDSVFEYTKSVLMAFKNQNTLPDIVQTGNELNVGFLWEEGKVVWSNETTWSNFTSLLKKAIDAVNVVDTQNDVSILVHYAGIAGSQEYYAHLKDHNVAYDMIGLSYYPFWHGADLSFVQTSIDDLSDSTGKEILIVETAYPWTTQWNDFTNNIIGSGTPLIAGYPATPDGQHDYLEKIQELLHSVNNNRGIGFCYWAPDWVAFNGPQSATGSSWENVTLFDFSNNALPAIAAFED